MRSRSRRVDRLIRSEAKPHCNLIACGFRYSIDLRGAVAGRVGRSPSGEHGGEQVIGQRRGSSPGPARAGACRRGCPARAPRRPRRCRRRPRPGRAVRPLPRRSRGRDSRIRPGDRTSTLTTRSPVARAARGTARPATRPRPSTTEPSASSIPQLSSSQPVPTARIGHPGGTPLAELRHHGQQDVPGLAEAGVRAGADDDGVNLIGQIGRPPIAPGRPAPGRPPSVRAGRARGRSPRRRWCRAAPGGATGW